MPCELDVSCPPNDPAHRDAGVARPSPAGCDRTMPEGQSALPLLRLGRLELGPGLHSLQPGQAASDLVVTAMIRVPDSGSERQYAWDVAWSDAAREASRLGADQRTAEALATGAGPALAD